MNDIQQNGRKWSRAIGIGIGVSILTGIFLVLGQKMGISPFPKPPSLAFAELVTNKMLPLPVGFLFHTAYVTFWSAIFVIFFPKRNLITALLLGFVLWLVILVIFFPILGWGFAGSAISPKLIIASFIPHLLFGLFLWALNKYWPPKESKTA